MYDSERPQKTATSTLTATIQRNENAPVLNTTELRITINDRYVLGQHVKTMHATDVDGVSRNCALKLKTCATKWVECLRFKSYMLCAANLLSVSI